MVVSRQQGRTALEHVLDSVIGSGIDSSLRKCLEKAGIEDVFTLCSLEVDTIEALTYDKSATELNVSINRADKNILKAFISYVFFLQASSEPLDSLSDWTNLTESEFDRYRIGTNYIPSLSRTNPVVANQQQALTASINTTSKFSPADLFRRGIKRDPNLFPTLKEEKFNDTWHRSFVNQARAQDVMQVLDSNYTPSNAEEKELFDEKQKFVYAVLEQKVLTDRGKDIIRNHENDYDAQVVYQKLIEHHLNHQGDDRLVCYFVVHYLCQAWQWYVMEGAHGGIYYPLAESGPTLRASSATV